MRLSRIAAALILAAPVLAPPAPAQTAAVFEALPIAAPAEAGPQIGLLSLPAGWDAGDRLAILLPPGPGGESRRVGLVADLLLAGIAVLELPRFPDGVPPDPRVIDSALAALRRTAVPGPVIVIGADGQVERRTPS